MIGHILVVDDDQDMCEMLQAALSLEGLEVKWQTSSPKALELFKQNEFDVVLTDLRMPKLSGIELCERIVQIRSDVPVVVFTAFGSMDTAISAIRAGAYDFVAKPLDLDILKLVLKRALDHRQLKGHIKRLSETIAQHQGYGELLGESPKMQKLASLLARMSNTDTSVLIQGESGTGKELVARSLHQHGERSNGPFIAVNCAALPEALLESELFGHVKGAFTDAKGQRKGLFLEAQGGTLFLDEIGDMPLNLQPKLLRALEERQVRPVGSNQPIAFDVRIVAATNCELESAIAEGSFREDLYYRLNVLQVEVPPLRTRGTDILMLANTFVKQFAAKAGKEVTGLSQAVAKKLMEYHWPGNVRELKNALEHAVVLSEFSEITLDDLPIRLKNAEQDNTAQRFFDSDQLITMAALEKQYILHVLSVVDNNRTAAAKVLGLDRKTLYRKLQMFEEEVGL